MQSIERYGIVALLFLVVTVVAVLMWDGGQGKKASKVAASSKPAPTAEPSAPAGGLDEEGAARTLRLSLDSKPGPILRGPGRDAALEPEARAAGAEPSTQSQPEEARPDPASPTSLPPRPESAPPELRPSREGPAPEPVLGRAEPARTSAYQVRAGDTLSEIAQRELGSARRWPEIVAANPGLDPAKLHVGRSIRIPASRGESASLVDKAGESAKDQGARPRTWTVGKGESLWHIAEVALGEGRRWREIAALNPRVDPDQLLLGQVLTLPAAAGGSAPARGSASKPPAKASTGDTLLATRAGSERPSRRGGRVK
jgi:nucleoid-associated protein YgaU